MDGAADTSEFEEAFPSLFLAAYHVTYRLLGNVTEAEDAAAEAVARALVSWRRVGRLAYREAWVARVATNLAIDELRRLRRRRAQAWTEDDVTSDASEDATLRLSVRRALAGLSARQRQVIALRYLADLDDAQVARVLGISVNSVKKHAARGRVALRDLLGPNPEVSLALE